MKNIVFITGATSGFGKAIAEKFASEGWNIVITGRREDRLRQIADNLRNTFHVEVRTLCFDIRIFDDVKKHFDSLPEEWQTIDVLVNNAGLALGRESFHEGDLNKWDQMIDTNFKGLIYATKVVSAKMIERKKGTIINIGSVAGKEPYTGGNIYSASKYAVDALTKNLRMDFLPFQIRVAQIAPGAAETEFSLVRFEGDAEKAKAAYHGLQPLVAEDIAEAAWFISSRPPHVCINDLVITCTAQANATTFFRKTN